MKTFRNILLLLLIFSTSFSAECQKSTTKAKVKSVVITEEKFNVLIKKQFKESETYYDLKGNIIEEITYKEGKMNKHFKYQYDADNNKIKEEEYDPSGRIIEYSEYKIENGLRTEKVVFDSNKNMKSKKTYTYTTFQ